MTIPSTIDTQLLQTYLGDHLTGASAGRGRARRMATAYSDRPIGPELSKIANAIDEEYRHLRRLIERLGLSQPLVKQLLASAAEKAGRLKPNARLFTQSPMSPLLEIELLRSAVNGKQGLWETVAAYADELGLDPEEYRTRAGQAGQQSDVLTRLHAMVRDEALRPESGTTTREDR